jgi:RNA recognition motif-containing protein
VFGSFGELVSISFPNEIDGKHRGFAFIEYENAEDAGEAMFNMNDNVLFGKVIHVNLSRPSGNLLEALSVNNNNNNNDEEEERPEFENDDEVQELEVEVKRKDEHEAEVNNDE